MTAEIIFASNQLGIINDDQLQSMLEKFNMGTLISFKKTANGAMGQTMFVSSTEGEFVFKGNPLYKGQLVEEKFFIENLQQRTNVPVPVPYIIDDSQEFFGWSYALMPRLQGEHLYSKSKLHVDEKLEIAELISKTMAEFHTWSVTESGELNTENFNITPFKDTYVQWLYKRIMFWLEDAKKYSIITSEDFEWVETLLDDSKESLDRFSSPTFVMGDFKPGNFLINLGDRGLEISGVFDFTNSYFADPISDLIKMITFYMDNNEWEMAKHLVRVYCSEFKEKEDLIKRMKVHMLHQRILDWGCAKAMNMVTWDDELLFSQWVEGYTDSVARFLEGE
ncbi:aminoglycoside phosphotransferase family protein [Bacillus sp. FJAT-50079]|uniref:aminoglycoside phosphotransferase family protein n=1 Tax=Bacillus sp. FJAT-50079 TaxID=2833577 RepID=UPI001BC96165|nr:aminoglycoside phosphotransferase family protein [Bacillus sp. FJAT-50079]MBS4207317.1 aminoglycoside phosphotransferase family protein [Bacillus sp. FJAT-50079]